ncbi:MAG: hypothetical protein EOP04_12905 [Proteobacteria bacterium]|nr:MAG: hypothetical protein EOP04_12905 [Pseudomonadota bacterium]
MKPFTKCHSSPYCSKAKAKTSIRKNVNPSNHIKLVGVPLELEIAVMLRQKSEVVEQYEVSKKGRS